MLTFNDLHPLLDWEGNETCAFVIKAGDNIELWLTPSLKPAPDSYAIGRSAWNNSRERARSEGKKILGTLHTHPNGPPGPSDKDLEIARHLRNSDCRIVWHPRSGTLTTYGHAGIIEKQIVKAPLWLRPLFWIFFY